MDQWIPVLAVVKRKKCSKYIFLALLSISILYFITVPNILSFHHGGNREDQEKWKSRFDLYLPIFNESSTQLSENFTLCLRQLMKNIQWLQKQNQQLHQIRKSATSNYSLRTNLLNFREAGGKNIHPYPSSAIHEFLTHMKSADVRLCLIEPSILFCMLPSAHKEHLLRKNFNLSSFLGAENIVTLAATEKYAIKLENESINSALESDGFRHWIMNSDNPGIGQKPNLLPTHHIYVRGDQVIHVVVFYQRSQYIWHGELNDVPEEILKVVKVDNFIFGHYAAAFEKFIEVQINVTEISFHLYIPSNPHYFLFQISSSRFLECNSSSAPSSVSLSKAELHGGRMSSEKFREKTLIALQEMKRRLYPLLISFWLACGSLLGWYRECNLLEHTHDVDFAAWATDASDDLVELFRNKQTLFVELLMGLPENGLEYRLNCFGLKLDLFFIYDDGKELWCGIHRPSSGYLYRLMYPKFTLCSAELLGHKVQVPCDAESVLRAEYGPDWKTPVTRWDYENSPFNKGLKYYWTKEERERSYIVYQ